MAGLPSESLVSLTDFTLCFLNHVQISPAPLIKSSNRPIQPRHRTRVSAAGKLCLTIVIYFHCARGKYALFVFVDVLKAHNVWVVNPLL